MSQGLENQPLFKVINRNCSHVAQTGQDWAPDYHKPSIPWGWKRREKLILHPWRGDPEQTWIWPYRSPPAPLGSHPGAQLCSCPWLVEILMGTHHQNRSISSSSSQLKSKKLKDDGKHLGKIQPLLYYFFLKTSQVQSQIMPMFRCQF